MDVEMRELSSSLGSDFWDSIAQKRFESIESQHPRVRWEYSKSIIGAFDEDIVVIGRMLRLFARRRNAHLPIGQLPVEVLGRIFYFVPPEDIPDEQPLDLPMPRSNVASDWRHYQEKAVLPRIRSILKLTYVCSGWRSAALTHSRLWTTIDLARLSDHYISTALSRSAGCALDIKALKYGQSSLSNHLFGAHDWQRIRSLDIDVVPFQLARILPPHNLLSSLTHLSAQNVYGNVDAFTQLFAPCCQVVLPDSLTSLALHAYQISWMHFPRMTQLTHLELKGHSLLSPDDPLVNHFSIHLEYPTLDVVLDILSHLPQLQNLSLTHIFPGDRNSATLPASFAAPDTITDTILLPRLVELRLEGDGDLYARLLGAIIISPTLSLLVVTDPYSTHALDILLAKCRSIAYNRTIFRYSWSQGISPSCHAMLDFGSQDESAGVLQPEVFIHLAGELSAHSVLIDRLRAYLPLNKFTHLDIQTQFLLDDRDEGVHSQQQSIYDIFRDTASVTDLYAYGGAVDDAISALTDASRAEMSIGSETEPELAESWQCLPKLRCLGLQQFPEGGAFTSLCDGLRRRHESGVPLEELVFIDDCQCREEDRVALQRYVVKPIDINQTREF
ncbi:hypothetical protein DENSPDRAFT_842405 [Dentipellis sp. KUC8613]|nr:hypothetical protein DENSPDRAFT_842405 [Dentipellis sp. KUC8613]